MEQNEQVADNRLFSQMNWLKKREVQSDSVTPEVYEYAIYSDARFTGQIQVPNWPYAFLNTVPADVTSSTVNTAMVLRAEIHADYELPELSRTNESMYHGGWFQDEIVALASLCLGVRLASGGISRTFERHNAPYGQPGEWDRIPKPPFAFRRNSPVLPDVTGTRPLDSLTRLESILRIEPSRYTSLVRSCNLYRDALWISESDPNITWLLLISALETAANDTFSLHSTPSSSYETFKLQYPELNAYLEGVGGTGAAKEVAAAIGGTLKATRKFVDFVMRFKPDPPESRPEGEHLRFKWTESNFRRMLSTVYGYRSRSLHAGTPFPAPMFTTPSQITGNGPGSEVPIFGHGGATMGGAWVPKDLPINLNTFHHIARNSLLNWWDCELSRPPRNSLTATTEQSSAGSADEIV